MDQQSRVEAERKFETEIEKVVGEECLRIIIVKHKRLFSVLFIFFLIFYTIMTCLGKGVEYLLTNEKTRDNIYKLLDAFVNKTVTQLLDNNYICAR